MTKKCGTFDKSISYFVIKEYLKRLWKDFCFHGDKIDIIFPILPAKYK